MQTYFVEPANPDEVLLAKDSLAPTPGPSTNTVTTLSEVNQCWIVKSPARTRQQSSSPFSEEEGGTERPMVVDMVKPQVPMEGAWANSQPSGFEAEPHLTNDMVRSKSPSVPPSTPRVSKVTPAAETADISSSGETQKRNPSLFVTQSVPEQNNSVALPEEKRTDSRANRSRSKCVIC